MVAKNFTKTTQNITCWAGVFYILATLAPISTYIFFGLLISDGTGEIPTDFLVRIAANETQVIIGGLIELVYALAIIGIIATLHPILKTHSPVLALSFFCLRFLEAIGVMFHSLFLFCLVTVSCEFTVSDATALHFIGKLLLSAREWTFLIGSGIVWSLSALILNILLYQNKLLPRWISAWGLVGATLSLIAYGLVFFHINLPEVFYLPIGVQEMVFAGWLIVKGLASDAKHNTKKITTETRRS